MPVSRSKAAKHTTRVAASPRRRRERPSVKVARKRMVACHGSPGTRGAEGRPGVGAGGSGCSVTAKSGSGPTGLWARAWLAAPNSTRAATKKRTSWRTHRTVDTLSPLEGHGQARGACLLRLPVELHDLARAQHLHAEERAGRLGGEVVPYTVDVAGSSDGHPIDAQDDVAAHGDLLAVDAGNGLAAEQPHVPRRRALGYRLDEEGGRVGHVEDGGELTGQHGAVDAGPERRLLQEELFGRVDGDHEAEALAPPGLRDVVTDDTDHLARHVEHGAARVARVDGGGGLEELGERHVLVHGVGRP